MRAAILALSREQENPAELAWYEPMLRHDSNTRTGGTPLHSRRQAIASLRCTPCVCLRRPPGLSASGASRASICCALTPLPSRAQGGQIRPANRDRVRRTANPLLEVGRCSLPVRPNGLRPIPRSGMWRRRSPCWRPPAGCRRRGNRPQRPVPSRSRSPAPSAPDHPPSSC